MSACFCIGPQNGNPVCPCRMKDVYQKNGRWVKREKDLGPVLDEDIFDNFIKDSKAKPYKKSGIYPLPEQYKPCVAPGHNPPNMLVVPPGHVYVHICNACGHESRIYSTPIVIG